MTKQFVSAYDEIVETFDYNEAKQVSDYGCQSGVCSKYIYYADTIRFFDNYEEEVTDYIITCCGSEILANIFLDNNCSIDMYKNDATWCYIELICSSIVDKYEYESTTCEELSNNEGPNHVVDPNSGEVIFEGDPYYNSTLELVNV